MQVRTVTDPLQILDQLRGFRPDLIVMDLDMPEINGIELTSVIRGYHEFVNIPIVFLSGEQDLDKRADALSVGGDDFITRPIHPRQLIAVVENRIRRSQMMRLEYGQNPQQGQCTLTQAQFLERTAAQLSSDPMRTRTHALLLLQPDQMHKLEGSGNLLAQLEEVVARELDNNDALAHLDDKTLGILVQRSNINPIHDLCSRLHEAVSRHTFTLCDKQPGLTIAIGMAMAQKSGNDAPEILRHAQLALQHALVNGPGKTVPHDESLQAPLAAPHEQAVVANNDITHALRERLANDEIKLLYQPMLGLVDPGTETWEMQPHLPAATGEWLLLCNLRKEIERAGLADQVDTWLLSKALDILQQRRNEGHKTHLFIPQSVISLYHPDYLEWVSTELRERQMEGTGLVLQFRLCELSYNLKTAKQAASKLREMDIRICLSDFAEKPAAFKVLRHIRGNFIRIAPRLLKADKKTIATVIHEAHRVNARVVVSNIDDPGAIDLLWSSGADLLQGDFIQQAMETMEYDFTQVVI
jgi:EAL domain-containing protein (putative c-di-GMP-specific phosphodiesterase class I)/DNA-binding response OmpR family regulator